MAAECLGYAVRQAPELFSHFHSDTVQKWRNEPKIRMAWGRKPFHEEAHITHFAQIAEAIRAQLAMIAATKKYASCYIDVHIVMSVRARQRFIQLGWLICFLQLLRHKRTNLFTTVHKSLALPLRHLT